MILPCPPEVFLDPNTDIAQICFAKIEDGLVNWYYDTDRLPKNMPISIETAPVNGKDLIPADASGSISVSNNQIITTLLEPIDRSSPVGPMPNDQISPRPVQASQSSNSLWWWLLLAAAAYLASQK